MERLAARVPPNPSPDLIPRGEPDVARPGVPPPAGLGGGEAPGRPGSGPELRITWVGHATFLLQLPGLNLLTDPVWSRRVSPLPGLGPARLVPPGVDFDHLPPIDGVLLSHDHYDHLDRPTVGRLRERHGPELVWFTPLGYRAWMRGRDIPSVVELDWWEQAVVTGDGWSGGLPGGVHPVYRIVCLPARHWTRRSWTSHRRLWASWAVLPADPRAPPRRRAGPGAEVPRGDASAVRGTPPSLLFVGDSGWFDGFADIGDRLGPFGASLLPIGAYEPRWFMADAHMDPDEAVRAYLRLGGRGAFVGSHWGTFRLTDEDVLEPPRRTLRAWRRAGLPASDLHLPGIGGTVRVGAGRGTRDDVPGA